MKQAFRIAVVVLLVSGCAPPADDAQVYSLFRDSVLDSAARHHVATFDAAAGEAYNRENCDVARSLFQAQPGVRTRFWCEQGRAR